MKKILLIILSSINLCVFATKSDHFGNYDTDAVTKEELRGFPENPLTLGDFGARKKQYMCSYSNIVDSRKYGKLFCITLQLNPIFTKEKNKPTFLRINDLLLMFTIHKDSSKGYIECFDRLSGTWSTFDYVINLKNQKTSSTLLVQFAYNKNDESYSIYINNNKVYDSQFHDIFLNIKVYSKNSQKAYSAITDLTIADEAIELTMSKENERLIAKVVDSQQIDSQIKFLLTRGIITSENAEVMSFYALSIGWIVNHIVQDVMAKDKLIYNIMELSDEQRRCKDEGVSVTKALCRKHKKMKAQLHKLEEALKKHLRDLDKETYYSIIDFLDSVYEFPL